MPIEATVCITRRSILGCRQVLGLMAVAVAEVYQGLIQWLLTHCRAG